MKTHMFVVTVMHDFVPPFPYSKVTVEAFNATHAINIVKKTHSGISYAAREK